MFGIVSSLVNCALLFKEACALLLAFHFKLVDLVAFWRFLLLKALDICRKISLLQRTRTKSIYINFLQKEKSIYINLGSCIEGNRDISAES